MLSEIAVFGTDVADLLKDGDCRKLIIATSEDRHRTLIKLNDRLRDVDPGVQYTLTEKINCAGITCKELKVVADAVNVIVSMTKEDSE